MKKGCLFGFLVFVAVAIACMLLSIPLDKVILGSVADETSVIGPFAYMGFLLALAAGLLMFLYKVRPDSRIWGMVKERNNRKYVLGAGGIFGLILLTFGISMSRSSVSEFQATSTAQVIAQLTEAAKPTETPVPPTNTPLPTNTALPPTNTLPPPTEQAAPMPDGFACVPQNTERSIGLVTRVIDGDTIEVEIDGEPYKVRYIGMDTPESTTQIEPLGKEASEKNKELVDGQAIILVKDVSETDRYGRLLRYVFVGDMFINNELVRQGYATGATYPPDVACADTFRATEQEARSMQVGLWQPEPTSPPVAAQPTSPSVVSQPTSPPSADNAPCNCSGPDLDCTKDFKRHAQAQACYDYCVSQGYGDVFNLDGNDNDGKACESLP
jgi:micrococcal nuclease